MWFESDHYAVVVLPLIVALACLPAAICVIVVEQVVQARRKDELVESSPDASWLSVRQHQLKGQQVIWLTSQLFA